WVAKLRSSIGPSSWGPLVNMIGAPTSATVISRSSSACAFSAACSCSRQRTRKAWSRDQPVSSKAVRAAAMAAFISAASASAAVPMTSSVAGFTLSNTPLPPATRLPPISSRELSPGRRLFIKDPNTVWTGVWNVVRALLVVQEPVLVIVAAPRRWYRPDTCPAMCLPLAGAPPRPARTRYRNRGGSDDGSIVGAGDVRPVRLRLPRGPVPDVRPAACGGTALLQRRTRFLRAVPACRCDERFPQRHAAVQRQRRLPRSGRLGPRRPPHHVVPRHGRSPAYADAAPGVQGVHR